MTVDLSQFIDKYAKVTFSDGTTAVGPIWYSWNEDFPYNVIDNAYTQEGKTGFGDNDIVAAEKPSYGKTEITARSDKTSNLAEDLAGFLHIEILNDVQEFPDWGHLLKGRIRESLRRKLGNIREDLLEGMVQRIAEKARW